MNRRTFLTGPLRIDTGRVSGVASLISGVTAFKGLSYAATTAGANRWRPPQRATSWTGVRVAATGSASWPLADAAKVDFFERFFASQNPW
ncbi:carboxylesterase family protein [Streptomyces sp. NBC_01515]|uniref:carboxylesterase family protein n=1 Tax=Streptomyces sp. NBC_01515 TaxID=2903890 RepID=UPI00386C70D0